MSYGLVRGKRMQIPPRDRSSRQRVYDAIEMAMCSMPDLRLGQLVVAALTTEHDTASDTLAELFYLEDTALARALSRYATHATTQR